MTTIQQYLDRNIDKGIKDFFLSAEKDEYGFIRFKISCKTDPATEESAPDAAHFRVERSKGNSVASLTDEGWEYMGLFGETDKPERTS